MFKKKIAFLVSHPTQFEVPLYKNITNTNDLYIKVFFWTTERSDKLIDRELGHPPGWDFDVNSGYNYSLMPKNIIKYIKYLRTEIYKKGNYDVIIINSWKNIYAIIAILIGIKSNAPIVLRGDSTLIYEKSVFKLAMKNIILKLLFRHIKAFMATGKLAKDHFIKYGAKKEKVFLLPYVIKNEEFKKRKDEYMTHKQKIRGEIGINKDDIVIISVIKFIKREGIWDLIRAFAKVAKEYRGVSLLIIGDGKLRAKVERYIKKKRIEKIYLVGYKKYSLLTKYYAVADVFVHPALEESWGVSVNEAMACELPVILSDKVGAGYDLVRNGVNGFVYKAGNVDDLKRAIENFIKYKINGKERKMREESFKMINRWDYNLCIREIKEMLSYLSESEKNI